MRLIRRLSPLLGRARPRFGLANGYREAATRAWEISPSIVSDSLPAIHDPAELDKITGVYETDTIAGEVKKAGRYPVHHKATMAYEIRDAVLSDGNLYSRKAYLPISAKKPVFLARSAMPEYKHAVLSSTRLGMRFFGHWMLDDLPATLAAYELGQPVSVLADPSPAQRDYLRLLELKPNSLTDAYFERIVVIDDVGQNDYKLARYRRLHELGRRAVAPSHARPAGVMLLRGTSGQRRVLVNELEVAEMARRRGMVVVDPMVTSAEDLMRMSVGVDLVLGVEGSQLTNSVMWMSLTGTMVTIQPPQRFTMIAKDRCDCVGIRFGFIIGDAVDSHDFSVDIESLERLLDKVAKPPA